MTYYCQYYTARPKGFVVTLSIIPLNASTSKLYPVPVAKDPYYSVQAVATTT